MVVQSHQHSPHRRPHPSSGFLTRNTIHEEDERRICASEEDELSATSEGCVVVDPPRVPTAIAFASALPSHVSFSFALLLFACVCVCVCVSSPSRAHIGVRALTGIWPHLIDEGQMSTILYALVASTDGVVLADVYASLSAVGEKAKKVLASIKTPIMERRCFVYNGYSYDMLPHKDGTLFMCVTEESCNPAVSFRFLEGARNRCSSHRSNLASLASQLRSELELFNDSRNARIREIHTEIAAVRNEMAQNMDKLMYRTDKLDTLLLKSSELEEGSSAFRQNAVNVQHRQRRRIIMICVIVAIILIALIFSIVLMICSKDGVNFDQCRRT